MLVPMGLGLEMLVPMGLGLEMGVILRSRYLKSAGGNPCALDARAWGWMGVS